MTRIMIVHNRFHFPPPGVSSFFSLPFHLLFPVLDLEKVTGSGESRLVRSRYASLPHGSKIQFLDDRNIFTFEVIQLQLDCECSWTIIPDVFIEIFRKKNLMAR